MKQLDPSQVALSGLNVIEASAGTGKTYTLAELYLRLVVEQGLTVDQILVVTFTNAATEELRDRLRQRLADERDKLIAQADAESTSLRRLQLAIQSFDESAIFTIHGFCQRVLGDFAFESGLHFDVELQGDDQSLLLGIVDDFWRREISQTDSRLARYLHARKETPESLLQSIRQLVGKPYLQYLPLPEVGIEQTYQRVEQQFSLLKTCWQSEQEDVIATLTNKTLLNGNKYRQASVEKWLVLLQVLLEQTEIPSQLFEQFDRFTPATLEDALKKDQVLPELAFWSACEALLDAVAEMQSAQALQYQHLRLKVLELIKQQLSERKAKQQVQSYDDLLLNLQQALTGKRGEWLVEKLRIQFPAALIDEFQDTDPVQYASFSRIYAGSGLPVFLVGDPKQAIYSFRGADIFTYLSAKSSADHAHTLGTNWRSHPRLVSAVNQLFERQADPFVYRSIPFFPVEAARDDQVVLSALGESAPLQFLFAESDKSLSKGDMTTMSASVSADEIAKLLNQAESGEAILLDEEAGQQRAISGGDVVVLVRNHRQAYAIQQCLQLRGINSVQQGRDNVFGSAEAVMLSRMMQAMIEPENSRWVIAALATELWSYDLAELYHVQQDEASFSAKFDLFYDCHQIWLKQGFNRAFRTLLADIKGQQQLLSLAGGERKLTNLLHLVELVHAQSVQQGASPSATLQWLVSRIQSIDPNDETGQLRLESDEQLVNIITIHKSKGLEYPIVFCPFLWDSSQTNRHDEVIRFHDAEQDYQAFVAFSEPALSKAAEVSLVEQQAEDLRLLYVALTRARERCVVCWGLVKGITESALFRLLHPERLEADTEALLADVLALSDGSDGTMSVELMQVEKGTRYLAKQQRDIRLSAKEFEGEIQAPWRVGSFSALAHGHDAEMPDYDGQAVQMDVADSELLLPQWNRFTFHRGAQAGTCLHALFEHWDFASDDRVAMQQLVDKTLLQYGFDNQWTDTVCAWLSEVLATELDADSDLKLNQLTTGQRLDELAFYFPVAGLSVEQIKQTLLPLLPESSPLAQVIARCQFSDLIGFMKGFIDLVFEHEGQYFIVDYKSNYLGQQQSQYQANELSEAMVSHDYPLQYLIYSVALHRYLRLRLPNYDPDVHLGGAYYLFIRGMQPEWGQSGVFFDKPSTELLLAFDRCLAGGGDG